MLIMEDLCWVIVHSGGLLEMHIWDAFWTLNCTQVPSMASGDLCGKWYAECKLMQTKSKKNIQNSVQYKCVHINVKYRYYLCIFCKARRIWVSLPASKTIFFFDTENEWEAQFNTFVFHWFAAAQTSLLWWPSVFSVLHPCHLFIKNNQHFRTGENCKAIECD